MKAGLPIRSVIESAPLQILIIEDSDNDFSLLKSDIHATDIPIKSIHKAAGLIPAIRYLRVSQPDVIFLNTFHSDHPGVESYSYIKPYVQGAAVIIVSDLCDKKMALQAIANGAQDYLTKGDFDSKFLEKTISHALERVKSIDVLSRANQRFQQVVKATRDLIWDWDLTTGIIEQDQQSAMDVLGMEMNGPTLLADEWIERIHPEDMSNLSDVITNVHLANTDLFEVQYRFLADNGVYRVIYDRGYVTRNHHRRAIRIIGAAQDITERIKLETSLQQTRTRQLKAVAAATIRAQEKERKRLGLELHDNITQILETSRLYLDLALSSGSEADMLNRSRDMIVLATRELRKLSHELLPPSYELGLKQAIEDLAETISRAGTLGFEICWDEFEEGLLNDDQQLTIYRIVQEQLNNILKHSEATHVLIELGLTCNRGQVELCIKDNGKGFDPCGKRKGVGLRNIISRAEIYDGSVNIVSRAGHGCELRVSFPVLHKPTNAGDQLARFAR